MGSPAFAVDRLARADVNTSIAVATRAFWDDPMFNFFNPDLLAQHKNLVGFFAGAVHDCADHGEVWVARAGPTVAGVAAWLPPGVFPATRGMRALRQGLRAASSVVRGRQRRTAFKMMNEMTARHPHEEHWYLAMLATDPGHQGRGIGTALLEPVLARADEVGVPTYLETQKESNIAYYRRFGFDVLDMFTVDSSPPLWQMQRQPR
jgi:ribosomal protein S18 acetylase RimI-like enzyme